MSSPENATFDLSTISTISNNSSFNFIGGNVSTMSMAAAAAELAKTAVALGKGEDEERELGPANSGRGTPVRPWWYREDSVRPDYVVPEWAHIVTIVVLSSVFVRSGHI